MSIDNQISNDPSAETLESALAEFRAPVDGRAVWEPDDSDGRTLFDTTGSSDDSVLVVFGENRLERWRSQALARIESKEDNRVYVGQVAKGPYAAPNGLPATSPMLVATQVEGSVFTPPYHGWVALSILGEKKGDQVIPALYRPRPNSRVYLLTAEETRATLNTDGDIRLGRALAFPGLCVGLRSDEKHHVPRHTLVVGTTGSGKSTSIAGLIEKLAAAGFCVIVLDVEGEYTTVNLPADSDKIVPTLQSME